MRRRDGGRWLLAVGVSLACVGLALALGTEHEGNQPIAAGFFGPDVLAAANLPSRVLWREVNGNPFFYFRGDTAALNEALAKFAEVRADGRDLILLAGPGDVTTWSGKKLAADWHLHVPGGLYLAHAKGKKSAIALATRANLTVFIDVAPPTGKVDAEQMRRRIADLDHADFATRQKAERALAELGADARPALRQALAGKPSAELRRRLERLLDRLHGIELDELKIPKGVQVLGWREVLRLYREDLKSDNYDVRGMAATGLSRTGADPADAVPLLIAELAKDRHEYVRRSSAGSLARIGKPAAAALPVLKAGLMDLDKNVRNAFEQAVAMIERAEAEPAAEVKRRQAIRQRIERFVQSARGG